MRRVHDVQHVVAPRQLAVAEPIDDDLGRTAVERHVDQVRERDRQRVRNEHAIERCARRFFGEVALDAMPDAEVQQLGERAARAVLRSPFGERPVIVVQVTRRVPEA